MNKAKLANICVLAAILVSVCKCARVFKAPGDEITEETWQKFYRPSVLWFFKGIGWSGRISGTCSGTLVQFGENRWALLTAAHCFHVELFRLNKELDQLRIRASHFGFRIYHGSRKFNRMKNFMIRPACLTSGWPPLSTFLSIHPVYAKWNMELLRKNEMTFEDEAEQDAHDIAILRLPYGDNYWDPQRKGYGSKLPNNTLRNIYKDNVPEQVVMNYGWGRTDYDVPIDNIKLSGGRRSVVPCHKLYPKRQDKGRKCDIQKSKKFYFNLTEYARGGDSGSAVLCNINSASPHTCGILTHSKIKAPLGSAIVSLYYFADYIEKALRWQKPWDQDSCITGTLNVTKCNPLWTLGIGDCE